MRMRFIQRCRSVVRFCTAAYAFTGIVRDASSLEQQSRMPRAAHDGVLEQRLGFCTSLLAATAFNPDVARLMLHRAGDTAGYLLVHLLVQLDAVRYLPQLVWLLEIPVVASLALHYIHYITSSTYRVGTLWEPPRGLQ